MYNRKQHSNIPTKGRVISVVHVLFVCLGNICRSPMAEAVFRHQVIEAGLGDKISIDSAGTGGWHAGEPPHVGTQKVLASKQIAYDTLRARQVKNRDFEQFDYIIGMDEENLANLHRLIPNANPNTRGKIHRLMDFAPHLTERNVEDPYYTKRFDYVYSLVEAGCRGLLEHIRQTHKI